MDARRTAHHAIECRERGGMHAQSGECLASTARENWRESSLKVTRLTVQLPIKIMEIQGQTLNYLNFWPIFEAEGIIIL
jgi:hypothetical protein